MEPEESNRVTKVRSLIEKCQESYKRMGYLDMQIATLESQKREVMTEAIQLNKKAGDIFANMTTEEKEAVGSLAAPTRPVKQEETTLEVVNG